MDGRTGFSSRLQRGLRKAMVAHLSRSGVFGCMRATNYVPTHTNQPLGSKGEKKKKKKKKGKLCTRIFPASYQIADVIDETKPRRPGREAAAWLSPVFLRACSRTYVNTYTHKNVHNTCTPLHPPFLKLIINCLH